MYVIVSLADDIYSKIGKCMGIDTQKENYIYCT